MSRQERPDLYDRILATTGERYAESLEDELAPQVPGPDLVVIWDDVVGEYIKSGAREIAARLFPCPVCHSTEWEHDCPPPTRPMTGLAGFIDTDPL